MILDNFKKRFFPSGGFQNLLEEYNHLQSKLEGTCTRFPLRRFSSPAFRADLSSEETEKILNSFSQTRAKLAEIYANGDFLEITLERLTRAEYEKK